MVELTGQFADDFLADGLGCAGDYTDEAVLSRRLLARSAGFVCGISEALTSFPSGLYGEKYSESFMMGIGRVVRKRFGWRRGDVSRAW